MLIETQGRTEGRREPSPLSEDDVNELLNSTRGHQIGEKFRRNLESVRIEEHEGWRHLLPVAAKPIDKFDC